MITPPENLSPGIRRVAMLSHCCGLLGCLIPIIGHLLPVLILWFLSRSSDAYVEENAREALNFQICAASLLLLPAGLLLSLSRGGLLIALLFALHYLGTVLGGLIAAAQVRDEKPFRYPLPFRLI
jgi:uncharacterized Tic20 family protein